MFVHAVDQRFAAVAFFVDRLADARQQVAADVALAVEAGDVLVELTLLGAVPGALRLQALEDEDVAELAAEVVAFVLGRGFVVRPGPRASSHRTRSMVWGTVSLLVMV